MTTHDDFDSLAALDAVGALDDDDQRQLNAHLDTCADCQRAAGEYSEASSLIARGLEAVEPPADVRGAIMDTVADEDDDVVQRRRLADSRWWLATAATVFFALWGWRELAVRAAREKVASRDAEIQTLIAQNNLLEHRNEKLNGEIGAMATGDTRTIALAGQQISPSASARVFLEPTKRRAIVFFANLPANANDKSYQLWIIRGDQPKPQSAGVFDITPNGTATLSVENLPIDTEIKGLAVTLEPKGGVEQPTNSNYYVMGKS